MAAFEVAPAVANRLKATNYIITRLPQGADGIIPASSLVGEQFPHDTVKLPCIMVQDGGTYGLAKDLPFTNPLIMVRVYDAMYAPGRAYYGNINYLIGECIAALDRKQIALESSYMNLFEIQWDNFISREDFDQSFKLPFRIARFRAFAVTNLRDQSPTD